MSASDRLAICLVGEGALATSIREHDTDRCAASRSTVPRTWRTKSARPLS